MGSLCRRDDNSLSKVQNVRRESSDNLDHLAPPQMAAKMLEELETKLLLCFESIAAAIVISPLVIWRTHRASARPKGV